MEMDTNQGLMHYGFYRGIVKQHLAQGRCKIFIPTIYAEEYEDKPDNLPDAEQAAPLFGGTNNGNGMFSYPNIGSVVWCFFQNGDQNFPVFFAATLGGERAVDEGQGKDGYPVIRDNVSPSDSPQDDTTKNGEDSQQHMINCGESRIIMRESGQVEIICEDRDEDKKSRIFMDASGSIQISASESIQIDTPLLKINAGQKIQIFTTSMIVKANNEIGINSPQMVTINENSNTVKSPAINMDATEGTFVAKAKTHAPFFLT